MLSMRKRRHYLMLGQLKNKHSSAFGMLNGTPKRQKIN